jgi:hypothetical protein
VPSPPPLPLSFGGGSNSGSSPPKTIDPPASTPTAAPIAPLPPSSASDEEKVISDLVRRNRGRLGTVLTSFRGVLGANDLTPYRKTLLGE